MTKTTNFNQNFFFSFFPKNKKKYFFSIFDKKKSKLSDTTQQF